MRLRYMVFSTAFSVLIALMVGTDAAAAKVKVKERTKYYSVSGNNGSEIYESMVRRGPKLSGFALRRKALATAEILVVPRNIRITRKNGRCRIAGLDLKVDIKYTLPKWRGSKNASRATRNAWSRFSKTAAWHEKQHGKIAKEHAAKLEKAILGLRPVSRRSCGLRSFRIQRQVRTMERQHERRQAAFDRKDLGRSGRGYKAQVNLLNAE